MLLIKFLKLLFNRKCGNLNITSLQTREGTSRPPVYPLTRNQILSRILIERKISLDLWVKQEATGVSSLSREASHRFSLKITTIRVGRLLRRETFQLKWGDTPSFAHNNSSQTSSVVVIMLPTKRCTLSLSFMTSSSAIIQGMPTKRRSPTRFTWVTFTAAWIQFMSTKRHTLSWSSMGALTPPCVLVI